MGKISTEQIIAAYDVASAVFDGVRSLQDGVQYLSAKHGMNPGSAQDFIVVFKSMILGKEFHRTIPIEATDYYLTQISSQRNPADLANAVAATKKHLDYYERLPTGGRQPTKRKLIEEWSERLIAPRNLDELNAVFEQKVEKALSDSPASRQARLLKTGENSEKIKVVTEVYARNPDVVAEILHQAQGRCGRCEQPAPFLRRKDGTPYLEVHHIQQLKDGGADTVENAIALCPNCHREVHFG